MSVKTYRTETHAREAFSNYRADRKGRSLKTGGKPDCKKGKPCGDVCIPKDAECKEGKEKKKGAGTAAAIGAGVGVAALAGGLGSLAFLRKKQGQSPEASSSGGGSQPPSSGTKEVGTASSSSKGKAFGGPGASSSNSGGLPGGSPKKPPGNPGSPFGFLKGKQEKEGGKQEPKQEPKKEQKKGGQNEQNNRSQGNQQEQKKSSGEDVWNNLNSRDKTTARKAAYEVFGLDEKATPQEVKKKLRELTKKYHPDKNKDNPEAEEMMKRVNAAYDRLKQDSIDLLSFAFEIIQQNYPEIRKDWWTDFSGETQMYDAENAYLMPLALHK